MSAAPIIVIIHGGWHTPSTYSKFTQQLEAAGLEVQCPALPSMNGARPPNADIDTDTAFVSDHVTALAESGRHIVAVMHSYGGQVGTNALAGLGAATRSRDGKKGGVTHLVYMAAFAMPEGGSSIDQVRKFGHEHLMPVAFDFAEDDTCVSRDPKTLVVGPGLSDAEMDEYLGTLVRWNGKTMYQPIQHCAWREIPVTYIYTAQDMTVPLVYQQDMVEKMRAAGVEVDTVELDTGHCPNVTKTKECVDVVKKVAVV